MLTIFFRAIIIYLALLITMRLMGKRQLGELQPYEFAITLLVADLGTIPMQDSSIPIIHGLIPIFSIFVLHLFITNIQFKNSFFRKVINGKPVIVINSNGIDYKAMRSLKMNINDLLEGLRGQGYFSPADIEFAIVETNGKLSVLPKFYATQVTNNDLEIKGKNSTIPYTLIVDNKFMELNIKNFPIEIDTNLLNDVLAKNQLKLKDVFLLTLTTEGNVFIQPYKGKAISREIEL